MLLGGIGRLEAELSGDFSAGWGGAALRYVALDEVEDLLLAGGQFGALKHGDSLGDGSLLGLAKHCFHIQ